MWNDLQRCIIPSPQSCRYLRLGARDHTTPRRSKWSPQHGLQRSNQTSVPVVTAMGSRLWLWWLWLLVMVTVIDMAMVHGWWLWLWLVFGSKFMPCKPNRCGVHVLRLVPSRLGLWRLPSNQRALPGTITGPQGITTVTQEPFAIVIVVIVIGYNGIIVISTFKY